MRPARRSFVWGALLLAALVAFGACSNGTGSGSAPRSADEPTSADSASGADGDGDPVPSSGCVDQDPTLAATTDGKFTSGGVERTFLLGIPSTNDGETPMPLVLDMHGLSQTTAGHEAQTQMSELGEQEGFVTVMPQGLGDLPYLKITADGGDIGFVDELLDSLEAGLCIDTSRLYLTGYSGGAMLTAVLSCRAAERFAAAAPVAATVPVADCDPARAVPVRAFQGAADQMWRYDGDLPQARQTMTNIFGAAKIDEIVAEMEEAFEPGVVSNGGPDSVEVMTDWALRNGCADTYTEGAVADQVRHLIWEDCPAGAATELYVIDEGGHTWPGSQNDVATEVVLGPTNLEVDATELIWKFFQQHHL